MNLFADMLAELEDELEELRDDLDQMENKGATLKVGPRHNLVDQTDNEIASHKLAIPRIEADIRLLKTMLSQSGSAD